VNLWSIEIVGFAVFGIGIRQNVISQKRNIRRIMSVNRFRRIAKMKYEQVYREALSLFGWIAQIDMCLEEMAELAKALLKWKRSPSEETRKPIEEELADVQHMINQMKLAFSDPATQKLWEEAKICKLVKKIEKRRLEIGRKR
jgi:hypothetical protein